MDLDNNTPALRSYSVSNCMNSKRVARAHDGTNQQKTNMSFLLELLRVGVIQTSLGSHNLWMLQGNT
jgi:hypothetical protein